MLLNASIDQPSPNAPSDPLALRVEGWVHAGDRHSEIQAVEIHWAGKVLGSTRLLVARPDVDRALRLPSPAFTGFSLLLNEPGLFGRQSAPLECHVRFKDGSHVLGASQIVQIIPHDHRDNHYGVLIRPEESRLFHRSDIYTSGPSVSEISPDCFELIKRYLGSPPTRVLDVGCGFGGYGRALRAAGYEWLGVEVKASDCVELARLGLPHRHVDGRTLPFADQAFDSSMCVEVLEHIAEPESFLTEIRRVTKKRFVLSVPNLELIPYLHRYAVVPWHLLEGDHKNFFTRPSLKELLGAFFSNVEVLSYAPIPLRTPEGVPLYNHLFAICDV